MPVGFVSDNGWSHWTTYTIDRATIERLMALYRSIRPTRFERLTARAMVAYVIWRAISA